MIGFVFLMIYARICQPPYSSRNTTADVRLAKIMKFIYKSKPQDLFLHRTEKCEKV